MNDIQLARLLGLVSLGIGASEIATGRQMARELGLGRQDLLELFGAREIGAGLMALTYPDNSWPIWARVAGDALDLALLASALGSHNPKRHNAAWATILVLGVTLIDVACATMLTRREQRARQTGRRTRVARPLGQPLPKQA